MVDPFLFICGRNWFGSGRLTLRGGNGFDRNIGVYRTESVADHVSSLVPLNNNAIGPILIIQVDGLPCPLVWGCALN
jgi:hypothetical protein